MNSRVNSPVANIRLMILTFLLLAVVGTMAAITSIVDNDPPIVRLFRIGTFLTVPSVFLIIWGTQEGWWEGLFWTGLYAMMLSGWFIFGTRTTLVLLADKPAVVFLQTTAWTGMFFFGFKALECATYTVSKELSIPARRRRWTLLFCCGVMFVICYKANELLTTLLPTSIGTFV